ncbi:MAG: DUF1540 domain-containing protein [Firmicutes bacterium]|nr:DUF1540 domain-containing protein [Bacillota bacterium]
MNKTSTTVKCKVDECVYNSKDYCTADSIKVESQAGALCACTCSAETECATFKKRS